MAATKQKNRLRIRAAYRDSIVLVRTPTGDVFTAPEEVDVEEVGTGLAVTFRINGEGRYVPVKVTLTADDPEVGVAQYMRQPLNRIATQVMKTVASPVQLRENEDGTTTVVHKLTERIPEPSAEQVQRPRARGRQRLSDDFLRDVATVWTQAPPSNRTREVQHWYRRQTGTEVTSDRVENWRRKAEKVFPEMFKDVR